VPELPEVETVRIGLNGATCDCPIQKVEVLLDRMIAYPATTAAFQQGLQGTSITEWSRRGKYLLATLVRSPSPTETASASKPLEPHSAGWLGVHLRMSGQLLWVNAAEPLHKHTRVRLYFQGNQELRFIDQRTFGQMWWIPPDQVPSQIMSGMGLLGPEPLSLEFSQTYLTQVFKGRDRPIKNALLDQSLIAGLGNIYVDESLFLGGLHPTRPCRSLSAVQIQRLHQAIETVIKNALTQGGTTFSDFRQVSGVNGNYGLVAWVYRRAGEPCRHCQTPLEKIRLAGRSCHFCPQCQQ
jgi:formamidopyrimidine-DNA glycosylase